MALINNDAVGNVRMGDAGFQRITTDLEAVNLCLTAAGYAGVSSLNEEDLDANDAYLILGRVGQRVQNNKGRGWWFNNEPNWEIVPNTLGEVAIPNDVLGVLQCYGLGDRKLNVTVRANMLYDVMRHTFDMTPVVNARGSVNLTFTKLLPFEHLPVTTQQAIAYQAASEFIVSKDADPAKMQAFVRIADQCFIEMQSEDAGQQRLNMFIHNPTQASFGVGAGGPNNAPAFDRGPYTHQHLIWRR